MITADLAGQAAAQAAGPLAGRDPAPASDARAAVGAARRLVVKVGSSSLTTAAGGLDPARLDALVDAVAARTAGGTQVVLVSSGAIAAGLAPLGLSRRPRDLATQQAAASVGQQQLAASYAHSFRRHAMTVGQVLLTSDDVVRRSHYRNAQRTFDKLLSYGVVPVVNENDTVATAEIKFGDNDRLAALVAHLIRADALILLSDVDALYTGDPAEPGSRVIRQVDGPTELARVDLVDSRSGVGTGGMTSKLGAAMTATHAGIPVLLAGAAEAARALAGGAPPAVGTAFATSGRRTGTRLLWLKYAAIAQGSITLDAGAVAAVVGRRKSLLPAGITAVSGDFESGDVVDLTDPDGGVVARGFVSCDAAELPAMLGLQLRELAADRRRPVVHADDLVPVAADPAVGPAAASAGTARMTRTTVTPTTLTPTTVTPTTLTPTTLTPTTVTPTTAPVDTASAADVLACAARARPAARALARLTSAAKQAAVRQMAAALRTGAPELLAANELDLAAGSAAGTSESLLDRLRLTPQRLDAVAAALAEVADLPDPIGQVIRGSVLPNGLRLTQLRVPLGVVAMIYEARPNVTVDATGIAVMSGNAVLLRGSASAHASNVALVRVLHEAGTAAGLPANFVQLVPGTDRGSVTHLMTARGLVDVIIPRGGAGLIESVVTGATVPVIETGTGNCHVYLDAAADAAKALPIVVNSKARRPSVCNAAETLLVHRDRIDDLLPAVVDALHGAGVTVHADPVALQVLPADERTVAAAADDFDGEFLSLDIAVAVVDSLDDALVHIAAHSTGHTDAIVTESLAAATRFTAEVDSAAVVVNASTAFTDGGEFGFGAEIGISTQKLHARGPMGLAELTSTKYVVEGTGQIRGTS